MPRNPGRPRDAAKAAPVRASAYGEFLLELAALAARHDVTISGEMRVERAREPAPLREWIDLAPERVLALLAGVRDRARTSDAARRTLARCRVRLAPAQAAG